MVNIISVDNGVGLSRDVNLIKSVLPMRTVFSASNKGPVKRHKVNLHVEHVGSRYFRHARYNFIIPNPEWFYAHWLNSKNRFEAALCKTLDSVAIFKELGFRVKHIGFTSEDRRLPDVNVVQEFVHINGKSNLKGTEAILKAWRKEYPDLHIYSHNAEVYDSKLKNVHFHIGRLSDYDLKLVQNKYLYHLCPSESEGWGHYIVEALSVGAVIITTDAAPMNEHIRPEYGYLAAYGKQGKFNFGNMHYVDVDSLRQQIEKAASCSILELRQKRKAAREKFEAVDAAFRQSFVELMSSYA